MHRVLILAFYFPPIAASGSLRPAAIARHLPEHGFEPVVLAAKPESVYPAAQTDDSLDVLLDPNLHLHHLPYKNPLQQLLAIRDRIRRFGGASADRGQQSDGPASASPAPKPGLKNALLDRLFIFPDHQKYWARPVLNWVKRIPENEKPDVILATANPWSSLLLAQRVAVYLGVPWVADFRDPWFRNPKPQPSTRLLPLVQRREASVIQSASHVIANTEALAAVLRADYPQAARKISSVTNGYARTLMPERREVLEAGPVELCHFGSVYPLRNPKTLLLALAGLAETRRDDPVRLRFVGGWDVPDKETNDLVATLEAQGLLIREKGVSRERALQKMAEASHLLILQQDFPLQIPAKLYEYIATGRPIIAIGGPGATRALIDDNGLGLCCGDNLSEITALLNQLADDRKAVPRPSSEAIDRFEYRQITSRVASILSGVLD